MYLSLRARGFKPKLNQGGPSSRAPGAGVLEPSRAWRCPFRAAPRSRWPQLSFIALAAVISVGAGSMVAANADAVVAADGSGNFKTIREAVDAAPQITSDTGRRWTIRVKPGNYRELVYVQREKRFISVVGDDATTTVLTFDLFNDVK